MLRPFEARLSLLFLATWFVAGCGTSLGTVTGEVTYEGEPVQEGWITFSPADGKGPAKGGRIDAGKYTVTDVPPGPKLAAIVAVKKVPFARSSEDMAKMAAEAKTKGNPSGIIDPADVIPPSAVGNNAAVDVKPGPQTHNFALKRPPGTKPRPK